MKTRFLSVIAAMLIAGSAFALDLNSARSSGAIGEQADGYVTALKPEASALASEVNAKRKAEYTRISEQNGQPADVVGQLAAPQIAGGLPSGAKYQDASGSWKTK